MLPKYRTVIPCQTRDYKTIMFAEQFCKTEAWLSSSGIYLSPVQSWNWGSPGPNLLALGFQDCQRCGWGWGRVAWPGNSESLRQGKMRPRCCEGEQSLCGPGRVVSFTFNPPPRAFLLGCLSLFRFLELAQLRCAAQCCWNPKSLFSLSETGTPEREKGDLRGYSQPSPGRRAGKECPVDRRDTCGCSCGRSAGVSILINFKNKIQPVSRTLPHAYLRTLKSSCREPWQMGDVCVQLF